VPTRQGIHCGPGLPQPIRRIKQPCLAVFPW
jgi:hypothetical protein